MTATRVRLHQHCQPTGGSLARIRDNMAMIIPAISEKECRCEVSSVSVTLTDSLVRTLQLDPSNRRCQVTQNHEFPVLFFFRTWGYEKITREIRVHGYVIPCAWR